MGFSRHTVAEVVRALRSSRRVIHVVVGPRQVGKTTAADEVATLLGWPAGAES